MRAWRLFWRDLRQGQLTLLLLATVLAVASVSSITLLTDRLSRTLVDEAGTLLAADRAVTGSGPVPEPWREKAQATGIQQAQVVSFSAMLFGPERPRLAAVRAVSANYPLRGELEVALTPFGAGQARHQGPEPGEVWLASRLFPLLGVEPGDSIDIGAASFRVAGALLREPDGGAGSFDLDPRALIHFQDLPRTRVVQPGSRVRYSWLLAGPDALLSDLQEDLEAAGETGFRWQSAADADRRLGRALERAEQYLLLAVALVVMLSGVAIAMSARHYVEQQADRVALLKTLGMRPVSVSRHYGLGLVVVALVALGLGLFTGDLLHRALVRILAGLLPDSLAAPAPDAYGIGAVTGLVVLLGFAWPPFLRLRRVAPMQVLRAADTPGGALPDWVWGLGVVCALVGYATRSVMLTLALLAGLILVLALSLILAAVLRRLVGGLADRLSGGWRIGFANLQRHRRQNLFQMALFGLTFMVLLSLVLIRGSLLTDWQQQLPEKAPNHFVYNVLESDRPALNHWLERHGENVSPAYPIVRGRLVEVNDQPIASRIPDQSNQGEYTRELNLTWAPGFGDDNRVVAGTPWQALGTGPLRVSVEVEYAEALGIQPGDVLTFALGGSRQQAEVASLRSLSWDSFNPNFYMIFNQAVGAADSAFYLVSFWLPQERKPALTDLLETIPTLTLLEVDQILMRVRSVVDQVTLAIEFVLAMVLLAGLLVLLAGIQSTLDTRLREGAILRTLGAPRRLLRQAQWVEFGMIGCLAGILAAGGAQTTVWLLQTRVFAMTPVWYGWIWAVTPVLGALLVGLVGSAGAARVVRTPPLTVLSHWQT